MEEPKEVKHYQVNGKYRIVFEQAASTKGVLGFKVEVNSDSIEEARKEAHDLLTWAGGLAPVLSTETK